MNKGYDPPWDDYEITLLKRLAGIGEWDILRQKTTEIEKERQNLDRQRLR